jgi:uncharacterized protein (DUF2336 family)
MSVKFIVNDLSTLYLLPPSLQDWLPNDHLARFVVEIVEQLDLDSLKAAYTGRGSRTERLKAIAEAKAEIERRAAERYI